MLDQFVLYNNRLRTTPSDGSIEFLLYKQKITFCMDNFLSIPARSGFNFLSIQIISVRFLYIITDFLYKRHTDFFLLKSSENDE